MSNWWMTTFSGRRVNVVEPHPADISLQDIAHALSLQCRFNGHLPAFYSVAQHSLLVAEMVPEAVALLHDASEAYLGDVIRPVKRAHLDGSYKTAETRFDFAIRDSLGLPDRVPDYLLQQVHYADRRALSRELVDLLHLKLADWGMELIEPGPEIGRLLPPQEAEIAFLRRAHDLLGSTPE